MLYKPEDITLDLQRKWHHFSFNYCLLRIEAPLQCLRVPPPFATQEELCIFLSSNNPILFKHIPQIEGWEFVPQREVRNKENKPCIIVRGDVVVTWDGRDIGTQEWIVYEVKNNGVFCHHAKFAHVKLIELTELEYLGWGVLKRWKAGDTV